MTTIRFPDPLHEILVLWPAYADLTRYVSRSDPLTADPPSIADSIRAMGDRAAALLYAHQHYAETTEACQAIVSELLAMLDSGRRPRSGREMGIGAQALTEGSDA